MASQRDSAVNSDVSDAHAANATADALNDVTDEASNNLHDNPKDNLHQPAHQERSTSWLTKWLPSTEYIENLEASYHLGNWVRDRQTNEKSWESMSIYVRLGMHLLYYGTYQERLLESQKTIAQLLAQSEKMGKSYDDPASKSHIQPFIDSFKLQESMKDMIQPDPTKYANFNEFFAREIKPEARPIDEPGNDDVTSSPADCRLTVFPTFDLATEFWVKGNNFTMERLFLNADLAAHFDGGSMAIARLAPQDYHRWHSPVSGRIRSIKDIPGALYTVNPQAINQPGPMNVYCENKRSVMLIERPSGAMVAIVAVGAMLVGSIKYMNGVEVEGAEVTRGQCLGAFFYGGSTVLVIYPKREVVFDDDLVKYSTDPSGPCETLVRVGWRIGCKP